jgi:hypothetical protein
VGVSRLLNFLAPLGRTRRVGGAQFEEPHPNGKAEIATRRRDVVNFGDGDDPAGDGVDFLLEVAQLRAVEDEPPSLEEAGLLRKQRGPDLTNKWALFVEVALRPSVACGSG